jgi:hypothetical protein
MIRLIFKIILITTFFKSSAQNKSLTDGPYIFYKGRQVIIESVSNGVYDSDTLPRRNKKDQQLKVMVPGRPGISFTVPIKTALKAEPAVYMAVEKMFVLSDIEGTFEGFNKLLLAGGVIDEQYNWTYGKGHLVICGDIFDRGDEVTACLWLLYKLENEAKSNGGYVHVILGNHEIMNLSGDTRYVHDKYMKVASLLGKPYVSLYNKDTELGRWLRTKNIMEKIGNFLCLHAGVSEEVNRSALNLEALNAFAQPFYERAFKDTILYKAGVIDLYAGDTSPFWYRGYFKEPRASKAQVDSSLKVFDVKHIIVGHTLVDSIQPFYENKIIAIDVNYHQGNYQALVVDNMDFYRMNKEGVKSKLN